MDLTLSNDNRFYASKGDTSGMNALKGLECTNSFSEFVTYSWEKFRFHLVKIHVHVP